MGYIMASLSVSVLTGGQGKDAHSRPGAVKEEPADFVGEDSPDFCSPERRQAMCEGVIDIAATLFNVSGRELRLANRCTQGVARVRQIAMYVCHVTLGIKLTEVGRIFGRDRTTVSHAAQLIEDLRDDAEFDRIIDQVETIVKSALRIGEVR
jgi:chromosomal replication initiation ATPase DnaA